MAFSTDSSSATISGRPIAHSTQLPVEPVILVMNVVTSLRFGFDQVPSTILPSRSNSARPVPRLR